HGRNPRSDLGYCTDFACRLPEKLGIRLVGLVGRQHVVIGGDDAEVRNGIAGKRCLVARWAGSKAVRKVAAGESRTMRAAGRSFVKTRQIVFACRAGALLNAPGDRF